MNLPKLLGFFGALRLFRGKRSSTSLDKLQHALNYRFRDERLLKQALTHKSSVGPNDRKGLGSNERMEFLGDSVLNCLVTDHLYRLYREKSEGQLSKVKSLIVSRKILGEIALSLDLGQFLSFGNSELKSGGTQRMSILSNGFEALLGAVYLDGGLESARQFLERLLYNRIDTFLSDVDNVNYKSRMLESAQRDGFGIPRYATVEAIGPDHAKEFKVRIEIAGVALGEGKGPNKKVAQQNAAREAILVYSKDFILSHIKGAEKNELVSH
jgi:ribonuclease III